MVGVILLSKKISNDARRPRTLSDRKRAIVRACLLGVITRRNLLVIYMSLELMLNSANLTLVSFSRIQRQPQRK